MSAMDRTAATFRYERWRSICSGVIETAATTFFLLMAVRHFLMGANAKALIAAAVSLGLLISPVTVNVVGRFQWPPALAASVLFLVGGVCCELAAVWPFPVLYVSACV